MNLVHWIWFYSQEARRLNQYVFSINASFACIWSVIPLFFPTEALPKLIVSILAAKHYVCGTYWVSISLFFAHMRLHFSTNSGMHDRTYKKSSLMIHLLRKVENEPVSGKKKINTYLLLLFSNYLMTLSTVLRIMQFEEAHTGLLCKIVQNSLYFCAGQERASEHTKDLKTHVMLALRAKTSFDGNKPFAASYSRGTKPPCWRAKVALGQAKQRQLPFQVMNVFCLSCPCTTFAF